MQDGDFAFKRGDAGIALGDHGSHVFGVETQRDMRGTIAPALLLATLKNVLNAVGRTGAIWALSAGIVLGNLFASILLVHGAGDWPGLGVAGAAWATILVNLAAALALLGRAMRAGFVRFGAVRPAAVMPIVGEILRLGWAAGAQQALESTLFVTVLYLLGVQSPLWLAASTVVFAVMELNYAMSGAFGEVLSARIAAARIARSGQILRLLRLGGTLSGGGAAILAVTLSTGCYWLIGIGGGMVLPGPLGLGAPGIWMGFCAGLSCAAGLLAVMTFRRAQQL